MRERIAKQESPAHLARIGGRANGRDHAAMFIGEFPCGSDACETWIGVEMRELSFESLRWAGIIGIHPREDRRVCGLEGDVERRGEVGLGKFDDSDARVSACDVGGTSARVIIRAVEDHQDVEVGDGLPRDVSAGKFKASRGAVDGDGDSDASHGAGANAFYPTAGATPRQKMRGWTRRGGPDWVLATGMGDTDRWSVGAGGCLPRETPRTQVKHKIGE